MSRLILNTAVSILLLLTTTGYTLFEHYCGGRLVSVSINSQTESCCYMEGECCTTELKHFQITDDYILMINDFNFSNNIIQILNLSNFAAGLNKPDDAKNNKVLTDEYPPPLETHTFLSLFQSYLI